MAQFNRPPRLLSPLPNQIVKFPKIPASPAKSSATGWLIILLPFAGIILTLVIMLAVSGSSGSASGYLLFIPIMVVSSLAGILTSAQQKKDAVRKLAAAHNKLKNEIFVVEKKLADLNQEEKKKRLRTLLKGVNIHS